MVIIYWKLQSLDLWVLCGSWNRDQFTLWTFSGPIIASSFNVNELYAMVVRCRELVRLGAIGATVEGDFFFLLYNGKHGHSYPCHLFGCAEVKAIVRFHLIKLSVRRTCSGPVR